MHDTGFFCVGKITKTHGYNGAVIVALGVDNPEDYENLESVFLEYNGKLVPFFVDDAAYAGKSNIRITFEDYDSDKKIGEFVGCSLFLPSDLSGEDEGNPLLKYISFAAVDSSTNNQFGLIKGVENNPAHPFFVVDSKGKEILVPAIDEFIAFIDEDRKTITFTLPEGLLDL